MNTIGIIGAGSVGGNLGARWASVGHSVIFGARDPQSDKTRAALDAAGQYSAGSARAASIAEAVAASEVIVLSTPFNALESVAAAGGDWSGKIVMDATNYFGDKGGSSVGEYLSGLLTGAHVVKAFNTVGANVMLAPHFKDQAASMFICGDDPAAKLTVKSLTEQIGFEAVDCGPLANARLLEALAELWVWLARNGYGREIAFKLLMR